MAVAAQCASATSQRYQCRRPERTLWYRIVQTHLETWLGLASGETGEAPPAHVERTFRRYLECGILAHGFARAYCDECQHDFLIAYSCKCRGVCPSCNTRRMAETAVHLVDHVFPPLPVRQWMPGATSDMTNMAVASFLYVKLISSRDKPCVAGRLRELGALQPLAEPDDEVK